MEEIKKVTISSLINPTDKQKEFLDSVDKYRYVLYGGAKGGGKFLSMDAIIYTPFGFKRMGDMKIGDQISNPEGGVSRVIAVSPQGLQDLYRLTFDDGATVEAGLPHLWKIRDVHQPRFRRQNIENREIWRIATTEAIMKLLAKKKKILVPLTVPVEFVATSRYPKGRWPVHPYALGVFLGDGHIGENNLSLTSADQEIVDRLERVGFPSMSFSQKENNKAKSYRFTSSFLIGFKKLGLIGTHSWDKFIPEAYKIAPLATRWELIRGLMDTDGYADARGHASYTTVSEKLAFDVQWMTRSLGFKANITSKIPTFTYKGEKKEGRVAYTVWIKGSSHKNLFSLQRKRERAIIPFNNDAGDHCRRIVSVEFSRKAESQCITVDHPNGLYVTDDFIVTHNSYILRWALILQLLKYARDGHKNVRVALFCEDYPALKDRQITKIQSEFPVWLGKLADSQIQGMSFTLAPQFGGGVIALRNLDDPAKYASSEFCIVAIDELTKNPEQVFDQLRSIVRWPGISNTKIIAATNPGGIGHQWVKRRWIDRIFPVHEPEPEQFHFVQAFAKDNPHLAKEYILGLSGLPEGLRKAYLDGSWDLYEGQFFNEWHEPTHVVEPFEVPDTWRKIRSIDHGRTAPTACMWGAVDFDGRIHWYREYYMAGVDADVNAREIARLSGKERYWFTVLDSACFAKTGSGETISEIYERNGIVAYPWPKNRHAGWVLFHEYLRVKEDGKPSMTFFKNCEHAIRTVPSLISSERDPEDLDGKNDDHVADSVRGALEFLHESKSPQSLDPLSKILAKNKSRYSVTPQNLNKFYANRV